MAPGGQRRLIFTGNVKTSLFNKYTPGSGVGGLNASVRRNKNRRAATGSLTMAQLEADYKARQNGTHISYPKIPCCPSMTSNPSNLAFPYTVNIPCPSISFTITNSDTWNVSYPGYPLANFTLPVSNGQFGGPGGTHQLINSFFPFYLIYFTWPNNTTVIQYITAISDSNNTITWTTTDSSNSYQPYVGPNNQIYETIIWTRVC